MRSFGDLEQTFSGQPARLGAVLARIDRAAGQEAQYRNQVPELLAALSEQTRIASITASNAIENVTVAPERINRLVVPEATHFRNRTEKEFAGYRDAVDEVARGDGPDRLTLPHILHLHRRLHGYIGGGGMLKTDDNKIVSYANGQRTIIFEPPAPQVTEGLMLGLLDGYYAAVDAEAAHPIILIGAFALDFLAIHPVADGNGRIARLLTSYLLLERDYGIPKYASLEQRIFERKNEYYDTLQASQANWHSGEHTIWPWVEYLAAVIDDAYGWFEGRVEEARATPKMTKQQRVRLHVLEHAPVQFTVEDLRRALPGISDQTIRLVLRQLAGEGLVESEEHGGRNAAWTRLTVDAIGLPGR